VRIVHKLGDRRDHFATLDDVWEMLLLILKERRRRELDPTVTTLRECLASAGEEKSLDATALQRLSDLAELLELSSRWADRAQALSPAALRRFAKLSDKVFKLVG
jgi:DNA-binding transcriptional regulator GbsR (MarR family)